VKKDLTIALIAVLVIAAVAFGLNAVRPDRPATPSDPYRPAAKAAAGEPAAKKSGRVIMHVNGEAVTEDEFLAYVAGAGEQAQMVYQTPQGRRRIAEEYVKLKALQQEGQRLGLGDDPELRSQLELVRAQLLASKALEKIVKADLEQRIRGEYEKEKAGAMGLRHIAVSYQGSAIPPRQGEAPTEAQAAAKASAIAARIRGGADFAQVAARESDDQQSAPQGGSLGAVTPDRLPPEVLSVVRALKPGEISNPVKTQLAIHIFKVEVPTLEELRPLLTQKLQQKGVQDTVTKFQKSAKVELDPQFFPPVPVTPEAPRQRNSG